MISGEHDSVPIDFIRVNRATRIRREVKQDDIISLAESIRNRGLLHDPIIKRDGELVAGETRWLACKHLGWDHIPIQWIDEVDEHELRLIELEENIKRKDLPWQDRVRAMKAYNDTRAAQDPSWSVAKTAKDIGLSERQVYDNIDVAKSLADPLVAAMPKYTSALNVVKRRAARAFSDQAQALANTLPEQDQVVLNADFLEWAPAYAGPKFNFIHCDFPYGIGRDKSAQGGMVTAETGGYADDLTLYRELLWRLDDSYTCRYVAESAHLIFWFSMNYYELTLTSLSEYGWKVDPHPLIWHKSDNQGIVPDPQRGTRRIYETAFFCYRGDRKVIQSVSNLFACPTSQVEGHASIKPESMLAHFFRMVVDENTYMLDPTCGSGSAIRACEAAGGKALGLEVNKTFAERAQFAITQARELRRVK